MMKRESVLLLKQAGLIALASLVVAIVVWVAVVWRLGVPFHMPLSVALRTAWATGTFAARVLLTAVLAFIILWFAVRAWTSRRPRRTEV